MVRTKQAIWIALTGAMGLTAMPLESQMTPFMERVLTWGPCEIPDREWDCFAVEDPRVLAAEMRAQAERGGLDYAMFTMAQVNRTYPREALDALADTLVEIAVDFASRGDSLGTKMGEGAAGIILAAAIWGPTRAASGGTAYPGGPERIVELAFRMPGGKPGYLQWLRRVAGDEAYFAQMRRFLTTPLRGASLAVHYLVEDGPRGFAVIRDACETGAVSPRARSAVQGLLAEKCEPTVFMSR